MAPTSAQTAVGQLALLLDGPALPGQMLADLDELGVPTDRLSHNSDLAPFA